MKGQFLATVAAVFVIMGGAGAVSAEFARIGTVDIDFRRDRETRSFDLDGPVERLRLRAERGDINCRAVNARFGNGREQRIFRGHLREGRDMAVDMPGQGRFVRSLTFACGAERHQGARIRISADIGRYRNEWQRSPRWDSVWSAIFGTIAPVPPSRRPNRGWDAVGQERFTRHDDKEHLSLGWRGRQVGALALRAQGSDARCSRVLAEFGNGRRRALTRADMLFLRQGRMTVVDLPGEERNLDGLRLRCRPIGDRDVTIGIFVR